MEKWRELTNIEDYEFDPSGEFDKALYAEDWRKIFDNLMQCAETTEEYLYNDWVDPVSTRNADYEYFNQQGKKYIVLKYYDGMYALYEIDENYVEESVSPDKVSSFLNLVKSGKTISEALNDWEPEAQENPGYAADAARDAYNDASNSYPEWQVKAFKAIKNFREASRELKDVLNDPHGLDFNTNVRSPFNVTYVKVPRVLGTWCNELESFINRTDPYQ